MVNHDNALQVRESVIIYLGTIWLGESVLALVNPGYEDR